MNDPSSLIQSTIDEYARIRQKADQNDPEIVTRTLSHQHEWTPQAAETLARLANDYGAFMLRNALALAVALDKEDGNLGF